MPSALSPPPSALRTPHSALRTPHSALRTPPCAQRPAPCASTLTVPQPPGPRSGNQQTLYTAPLAAGTDPRDAVVEFYSRHYSADRCALAVLGRQALDELETMVRQGAAGEGARVPGFQ